MESSSQLAAQQRDALLDLRGDLGGKSSSVLHRRAASWPLLSTDFKTLKNVHSHELPAAWLHAHDAAGPPAHMSVEAKDRTWAIRNTDV